MFLCLLIQLCSFEGGLLNKVLHVDFCKVALCMQSYHEAVQKKGFGLYLEK